MRCQRWISLVSLGCFAGLQLLAQITAQAETPQQTAARLLSEGRELLKNGDPGQAVIVLMKAQGTVPSAEIQLEIAAAYEGLDDPVKAAELYETLKEDPGLFGALKKRCEDRLADLRGKLGRLTVECKVNDALVKVNDREVGKTPLPHPIYVEPGEVTIVVTTPARRVELDRELTAGADETVTVSFKEQPLRLRPPTAPPAPEPQPTTRAPGPVANPGPAPSDQPSRGWILGRRWTWIAAAGTVVVGAVGAGLGISAANDYSEYKDPDTSAARYPELESRISTKATTANVLLGVAGGLAVTSVVLFLVEGTRTRHHARQLGRAWASAGPLPGRDGGQLILGLPF